jgi:hypothetical protein
MARPPARHESVKSRSACLARLITRHVGNYTCHTSEMDPVHWPKSVPTVRETTALLHRSPGGGFCHCI